MKFNASKTYLMLGLAATAILLMVFADRYSMPTIRQKQPKITVVFIIDQFAYHYLPRVGHFLKHGIRTMLDQGVSCTDAHFPHAMPATAPGHAALSTGAYPKEHGMINNGWVTPEGTSIACDYDTPEKAAVFNPISKKLYNYGSSAQQIMVDGLSDQFMKTKNKHHHPSVFALSLKSRSAVIPASKLGKAIWYDKHAHAFTSSTAYYQTFPDWLDAFNKKTPLLKAEKLMWNLYYDKGSDAYAMHDPETYQYTASNKQIAGTEIPVRIKADGKDDNDETWFCRTPQSSQLLCDLGKEVINTHLGEKKSDRMLLWISLSNFDKTGHLFGPDSIENIDLLYHLDQQIGDFIDYVEERVGKGNALFVLTSDHGVAPIPELLSKRGYKDARRVLVHELIDQLNAHLQETVGIEKLITHFKAPHLYFQMSIFNALDTEKQHLIIQHLKEKLRSLPYIIDVWTAEEMQKLCFAQDDLRNFYKQQIYPGRSGQLIIGVVPFTMIGKWKHGTGHRTPYNHDTHVPLAFYWPGTLTPHVITKKVWMLQCAPTISTLLHIGKPSAAYFDVLF